MASFWPWGLVLGGSVWSAWWWQAWKVLKGSHEEIALVEFLRHQVTNEVDFLGCKQLAAVVTCGRTEEESSFSCCAVQRLGICTVYHHIDHDTQTPLHRKTASHPRQKRCYFECHFVVISFYIYSNNNDDWYVCPKCIDVMPISFLAKNAEKTMKSCKPLDVAHIATSEHPCFQVCCKTSGNLHKNHWPTATSQWFDNWFKASKWLANWDVLRLF